LEVRPIFYILTAPSQQINHTDISCPPTSLGTRRGADQSVGRWSIPLHLLKNRKVIREIKNIGMAYEGKINESRTQPLDRHTSENNPQSLFADLKTKITSFARDFAKKEYSMARKTPQLRRSR